MTKKFTIQQGELFESLVRSIIRNKFLQILSFLFMIVAIKQGEFIVKVLKNCGKILNRFLM
jgi:hypothetical protein